MANFPPSIMVLPFCFIFKVSNVCGPLKARQKLVKKWFIFSIHQPALAEILQKSVKGLTFFFPIIVTLSEPNDDAIVNNNQSSSILVIFRGLFHGGPWLVGGPFRSQSGTDKKKLPRGEERLRLFPSGLPWQPDKEPDNPPPSPATKTNKRRSSREKEQVDWSCFLSTNPSAGMPLIGARLAGDLHTICVRFAY